MLVLDTHPPPFSSWILQTEALKTYLFPQMTPNNLFFGGRREKAGTGCQGALRQPAALAAVSRATNTHPGTGLLCPAQHDCMFMSHGHEAHSSSGRDILSTHSHTCTDTQTHPRQADHFLPTDPSAGSRRQARRGIERFRPKPHFSLSHSGIYHLLSSFPPA